MLGGARDLVSVVEEGPKLAERDEGAFEKGGGTGEFGAGKVVEIELGISESREGKRREGARGE